MKETFRERRQRRANADRTVVRSQIPDELTEQLKKVVDSIKSEARTQLGSEYNEIGLYIELKAWFDEATQGLTE
jgi:hypothetical protein